MGEGLPQSTGCNHHPCLPGGAPMSVSHISAVLQTPSLWQLAQFIRHHQDQWPQSEEPPDLERFERELHDHVMAVERNPLGPKPKCYLVAPAPFAGFQASSPWTLQAPHTQRRAVGNITERAAPSHP